MHESIKALSFVYGLGFVFATFRNLWLVDEGDISFEEAFARTVVWPVCVLVAFGKGLFKTVVRGFP